MTGSGVERTPRTAYRSPYVSPCGVSTPLPPHIQGAERPNGTHTRPTGVRWGLRVLVVGGLAGAAWLLTGAAAQAADRTDGPVGSLLGSVVESDTTAPVTGLLQAAVQPLEARPAHHKHRVVADVLDVPRRVLPRPVEIVGKVTRGADKAPVDTAVSGVDQVLRSVTGTDRLTGEPASVPPRLTEIPRHAAERPVAVAEQSPEPDVDPVPADEKPVAEKPADEKPAIGKPAIGKPMSRSKTLPAPAVTARSIVEVHHGKAHSGPSGHRRSTAHAVAAEPQTASEDTPGGDGPAAPLRLHLGDVSGIPTSGSGTPTEGGSAAFLPAAVASSTMACHPLPIASDVEVRRCDAEAPTVSPD